MAEISTGEKHAAPMRGRRRRRARTDGWRGRDRGLPKEPITEKDVHAVYHFLLGRDPSPKEVRDCLADGDVDAARARIVALPEFLSKADEWRAKHPLPVFYHVAKTGGRSFNALSREIWGNTVYWNNGRRGQSAGRDIRTEPSRFFYVPLIGGHMLYVPALFDGLGRQVVHLAMMREPVSRAISMYNFVRSFRAHPMREDIGELSLFEALTQVEKFRSKSCGHQLRVMFGKGSSAADRQDILQTERYVIGKLEYFDKFVSYVGDHIFARSNLQVPHENSGSSSYKEDVRKQNDFERALELLKSENEEELKFFNSFPEMLISEPMQLYSKTRSGT